VSGGILSLCCFVIEVISLHGLDSFLYQQVDGVILMRLLWAACSLVTGFGMLWETFESHTRVPFGRLP
jgi:hypothetical protein